MTNAPGDGPIAGVELDRAVRTGTQAVLAAQLGSQVVSIVTLAVLYRWVHPAEFGLIGMAMPLVLVAQMFASFGLNVAAIQKRDLTDEQSTGIFWANLAFALAGGLVIGAGGPLLARIYSAPRLAPLCLALSASLLVAAVGTQHRAMLERRLMIRRLVTGRLLAQTLGGVAAIAAAIGGAGLWALVVQQYVENAVLSVASWLMIDWRPGMPRRGRMTRELLGFGGAYWLSSLMFYVAQNADKILIASLFGHTRAGQVILGMYTQCFNLMMKPVSLVSAPLTGIMLPALSRARPRPEQYATMVADFYRMVGIVLFPCAIGMAIVADLAMILLGGEPWQPAGVLLRALSLAILGQGLINIAGSVLASAGKAQALFRASAAVALLHVQGYFAAIYFGKTFGQIPSGPVIAIAWSYSLVLVGVLLIPYLSYCFYTVKVPSKRVFAGLWQPFMKTCVMGAVVVVLRMMTTPLGLAAWAQLVILTAAGVLTYVTVAASECRWLWNQFGGPTTR